MKLTKTKKGLYGMSNSWRLLTFVFALILISASFVFLAYAVTTTSNNNAPAQTITADETDFLVMDFNLIVGSDSTLGGLTPAAGTVTVDGVDADWTNIYYFDAVGGGVWNAGADALFVDDGNKYYDATETIIAGITTENTGPGVLGEPDGWNLFFKDAADGGAFDKLADWIGIDDDSDDVYRSAPQNSNHPEC